MNKLFIFGVRRRLGDFYWGVILEQNGKNGQIKGELSYESSLYFSIVEEIRVT